VIFEVRPKRQRFDEYLALAKSLKPAIEAIDGFIAVDRLASKRQPEKLLSLSDWRDEKALIRWRTLGEHHAAQERGRFEIFADYRLRVGEVVADTSPTAETAPREQRFDETETGDAKAVTITEFLQEPGADFVPLREGENGAVDTELFESIYQPGKLVLLVSWRDRDTANRWTPQGAAAGPSRHRTVRIIRDYGMNDRREAPQYYPPVK
jgi:heme-degrading monooxygenase HmoA